MLDKYLKKNFFLIAINAFFILVYSVFAKEKKIKLKF